MGKVGEGNIGNGQESVMCMCFIFSGCVGCQWNLPKWLCSSERGLVASTTVLCPVSRDVS